MNEQYGFLTVINDKKYLKNSFYHYDCICRCGKKLAVRVESLLRGHTKSCGCYQKLRSKLKNTKTGESHTRTHKAWRGLFVRCYNKKSRSYKDYGGRGIFVCARWKKYENFRDDMGYCPDDMVIDRINNNGNYEPSNCRWVTKKQNAQNRRSSRIIFHNGINATVSEHSRLNNIHVGTVFGRLKRGWSVEDALSIKPYKSAELGEKDV